MRVGLAKFIVLFAVSLYAVYPCIAALPDGGACGCTGSAGVRCGTEGFVCSCCLGHWQDCEEVSFSTCKGMVPEDTLTQPPAMGEPMALTALWDYPAYSLIIPHERPSDGYRVLPEKPPSAA